MVLRIPAGVVSGDMFKAVYDPDDGKIDIAQLEGAEPTILKGDLLGTVNQVSVDSGTGKVIGSDVTLSLPQDIDINASPDFNAVHFNLTPTIQDTPGMVHWDEEYKTLAVRTGVPGVTVQVGARSAYPLYQC